MNLSVISQRIEITFWTLAVRLMKEPKLLRLVLGSFAFAISLMFGWLIFSSFDQVNAVRNPHPDVQTGSLSSLPVVHPESVLSVSSKNQQKFLLVVVDQLQPNDVNLESMWLATYVDSRSQITFIPLFPASLSDGMTDGLLADSFNLNHEGMLSQEFLNLMVDRQIVWDHYIILDEIGLAMLIDTIGGIDLGRGTISGADAISQIPTAIDDQQATLFAYASLFRSYCRNSSSLIEDVEVLDLTYQLSSHLHSDIAEQYMVDEWQRLRKSNAGVTCEFHNLYKSSSLP